VRAGVRNSLGRVQMTRDVVWITSMGLLQTGMDGLPQRGPGKEHGRGLESYPSSVTNQVGDEESSSCWL
jgi:hypothetical protein